MEETTRSSQACVSDRAGPPGRSGDVHHSLLNHAPVCPRVRTSPRETGSPCALCSGRWPTSMSRRVRRSTGITQATDPTRKARSLPAPLLPRATGHVKLQNLKRVRVSEPTNRRVEQHHTRRRSVSAPIPGSPLSSCPAIRQSTCSHWAVSVRQYPVPRHVNGPQRRSACFT